MKILVVDDLKLVRMLVERILANENHEVVLAANGAEALELVGRGDIRLVICDWNMPEVDGVQFCRQLRKSNGLAYVYVIMITVRDSDDERMVARWAGADDFISKPFDDKDLVVRVRHGERIINEMQESEARCHAFQECFADLANS